MKDTAQSVAEILADSQVEEVLAELDRDLVGLAPVKAKPSVCQWPEISRIALGGAAAEEVSREGRLRRNAAIPVQAPPGSGMKKHGPPPWGIKRLGKGLAFGMGRDSQSRTPYI